MTLIQFVALALIGAFSPVGTVYFYDASLLLAHDSLVVASFDQVTINRIASNGTVLQTEVAQYNHANYNDTAIMDLRQWNDTHFVHCTMRKCNICPFAKSTSPPGKPSCEQVVLNYYSGPDAGDDLRTNWISAVNIDNELEFYLSYVEYSMNSSHWWSYLVSEVILRSSGKRAVLVEQLWTDDVNAPYNHGTPRNLQIAERFKNLLTFHLNGSVYAVDAYYKPQRDKSTAKEDLLARLSRYEYDPSGNRLLRTDAVLECPKDPGSEGSDRPLVATLIGDTLNIVFLVGTNQAIRVYAMADIIAALDKLPSCIFYSERIPERMKSSLPPSVLSLNPAYCGTHLTILRHASICGLQYTLPSPDAIGRIRSIAGAQLHREAPSFVMSEKSLCRAYMTSPGKATVNCLVNFAEECRKSSTCLSGYNPDLHNPSIAVDRSRNVVWFLRDHKIASLNTTCGVMYPLDRCRDYSPEMMRMDKCVWCVRNDTYPYSLRESDVSLKCEGGTIEKDACPPYVKLAFGVSTQKLSFGITALLVALALAAAVAFLVVRQYKRSKEWEIPYDEVQLGKKIGQGSFGVVFRAYRYGDVAVKQLFAVKPRSSERRAFRNEIRLLKSLRHTNVLGLLGVVTEPQLAIVTDWCHGSLYQQIHVAVADYDPATIFRFCKQIAEGMNYLHSRGVLHRDLKTGNILLTEATSTTLKICDFGLSIVKAPGASDKKAAENPVGSILWMAPEIINPKGFAKKGLMKKGSSPYSVHSDTYAFGICIYELLFRRLPYVGKERDQITYLVGAGLLPLDTDASSSGHDVTRKLMDLMCSCTSYRLSERPTFQEICVELRGTEEECTEPTTFSEVTRTAMSESGYMTVPQFDD